MGGRGAAAKRFEGGTSPSGYGRFSSEPEAASFIAAALAAATASAGSHGGAALLGCGNPGAGAGCRFASRTANVLSSVSPAAASSWNTTPMQWMLKRGRARTYDGDSRCCDHRQVAEGEEVYIKKAAR